MPYRWFYDSPHIRHSAQAFLCVSSDAGRAVVLRIEPPVAFRPFGLSSLTPSRLSALRTAFAGAGASWLAVPCTVSRRSRRQGLRVPCTLASLRPSVEP
jgi:hypothetical protein